MRLLLASCVLLTGCSGVINVSVFSVAKSANATAAPLTPKTYCMALMTPDVEIGGGTAVKPPSLSAEQKQFCDEAIAKSKKEKTTP